MGMYRNPLGRLILARLFVYLVLIVALIGKVYSWNALGHRLIAQIAYDHLTKDAKRVCNHYNHALDSVYRPQSLVNAAAWLDYLHDAKKMGLGEVHYVNLPFSLDGTPLVPVLKVNAITAIEEAKTILHSKKSSDFVKGFYLRLLIHVVGDIHQPLHAASQISQAHPAGDKGGNLVLLGRNRVAANLHAYWDKGGGLLVKSRHFSHKQFLKTARKIEEKWPCDTAKLNLLPEQWAKESHQIAIQHAYSLKAGQKPDRQYQHNVKFLTEQRIALAGCRLAALLNQFSSF